MATKGFQAMELAPQALVVGNPVELNVGRCVPAPSSSRFRASLPLPVRILF